ncbi:uncharacterized transporter slc-17.2 [Trichonephila clavipes]|nr:uncharacterized transporter slc-17.2 [Trichonephila clavipes]
MEWNSKIEGIALGAVYYGQMVSFIPGGRMAELYGGKKMIILCTLISSLATIMLPVTAIWSPYAFIAARIAVGIGTGPIIPIVFYMLGKWIPEHERSFHASFILSGYGIGSFLAVIVSGALCGTTVLGGWPSVFYIGAVSGILWCVICAYFMYETPHSHPRISEEELSTIVSGMETSKREKILSIPWKEMAFSVPLWSLAIGFFGQFWLLGFFSTVHALYMGTVLKLSVAKFRIFNGLTGVFVIWDFSFILDIRDDEAHLWLNGYVNKQNCRIWSEANPQVYVETPLHPEKLTVWCALWAGGIIDRATIDLLKDTFGDRLISRFGPVNWLPRSCDLTPLDYFLWGYVKSLVYADKPQTLDHLEDNIRRVIADIRPQVLEKVIENWTSRLDYIRASRGSPMPEIIFKM